MTKPSTLLLVSFAIALMAMINAEDFTSTTPLTPVVVVEDNVAVQKLKTSKVGLVPPLCSSGTVWQELHIKAGDTVGLPLSGRGDQIVITCLSGFIWDMFSGHPKVELRLYNIDTSQFVVITDKVNATYYDQTPLVFKSTQEGSWGLTAINHNSLWNADFTLVIDYFVRPSPPSCKVCPNVGYTGPNCTQPCSANCYQCCQDNKDTCTVCAAGASVEPTCQWRCQSNCLYCDNMGGCHVCANASVSGPKCDQCRPAACRQPYLADCPTQCENHYIWCEMCRTATEKASSIIQIMAEVFETEQAATKAIAAAGVACLFLGPIAAVGCEFGLTTLVEAGVTKFAVSWLFKEAANQIISRGFCAASGFCSGPTTF